VCLCTVDFAFGVVEARNAGQDGYEGGQFRVGSRQSADFHGGIHFSSRLTRAGMFFVKSSHRLLILVFVSMFVSMFVSVCVCVCMCVCTQLITEADASRMFSAVLKYHKNSLLQAGVVDLHFTYGALETLSFAQQQDKHKQMEHKEVFMKVQHTAHIRIQIHTHMHTRILI
jgi:type IV secretory pathway VirB3-like protein